MNTIFNFFRFIKYRLSTNDEYIDLTEDNSKLTKRIAVRITPEEKELIDKFCELKNVSISRFIRIAANNEIARFIINHKVDEEYYNSKVS